MLHGADKLAIAESMITREFDSADFDFGAFVNFEYKNDRVARGDALVLRRHFRKLPPMFAEQFLNHHFSFLDFGGVEGTFDRQAHLALLQAVENVGFGDGVVALITDAADLRPLFHVENNNFTVGILWIVFHAQLYVFEKLRVPKRLEIAAKRFFVVDVALAAENARLQGVAANTAIAVKLDARNYGLRLPGGRLLRFLNVSGFLRRIFLRHRGRRSGFCACYGGRLQARSAGSGRQERRCKAHHEYGEGKDWQRQHAEPRTDSPISGR